MLLVDEVHTLVGAGSVGRGGGGGGGLDISNLMKPALARGELQCIGATTLDEPRKYIEREAALERRFQPVTGDEQQLQAWRRVLRTTLIEIKITLCFVSPPPPYPHSPARDVTRVIGYTPNCGEIILYDFAGSANVPRIFFSTQVQVMAITLKGKERRKGRVEVKGTGKETEEKGRERTGKTKVTLQRIKGGQNY